MISLVVPAFNEERYLPRLLDSVDAAAAAYRGAGGAVEVIVADNGSADGTARVAAARGCRVVAAVPRAIAAVRNAGARAARGEILTFVDADAQVHERTFLEIARLRMAEDVAFHLALRRLGRRTGRHLVRARRAKAIASTRKFDEHGDWHYFRVLGRGLAHFLGLGNMDDLTERYWYKPSR